MHLETGKERSSEHVKPYPSLPVILRAQYTKMATATVMQTTFHPFEKKMQRATGLDPHEMEAFGESYISV